MAGPQSITVSDEDMASMIKWFKTPYGIFLTLFVIAIIVFLFIDGKDHNTASNKPGQGASRF